MSRFAYAVGVATLETLFATSALAQPPRRTPPVPATQVRFEAAIGGSWLGGTALGSRDAELRANSLTPAPFRLFTAETRVAAAPGVNARAGYWLTRSIAVEAAFARFQPELRTRISGDAEGAPTLTASERLDQYFFEGSVVWLLNRIRLGRGSPFLSGGAGYLRQLHEGRTVVEGGQLFHAGGGIRYPLVANAGRMRAIGLRIDGRLYILTDGVQLEDQARAHGAVSAAVFVGF